LTFDTVSVPSFLSLHTPLTAVVATDVNVQSSPESADLEADDARSSAASTSPSQLVKLIVPVAPPAPSAGDTGSCVSSVASQVVPADHLPLGECSRNVALSNMLTAR
jgi:hypothetical protein